MPPEDVPRALGAACYLLARGSYESLRVAVEKENPFKSPGAQSLDCVPNTKDSFWIRAARRIVLMGGCGLAILFIIHLYYRLTDPWDAESLCELPYKGLFCIVLFAGAESLVLFFNGRLTRAYALAISMPMLLLSCFGAGFAMELLHMPGYHRGMSQAEPVRFNIVAGLVLAAVYLGVMGLFMLVFQGSRTLAKR